MLKGSQIFRSCAPVWASVVMWYSTWNNEDIWRVKCTYVSSVCAQTFSKLKKGQSNIINYRISLEHTLCFFSLLQYVHSFFFCFFPSTQFSKHRQGASYVARKKSFPKKERKNCESMCDWLFLCFLQSLRFISLHIFGQTQVWKSKYLLKNFCLLRTRGRSSYSLIDKDHSRRPTHCTNFNLQI